MITIGNFPDLASARIALSYLEAAGIRAVILDEFLAGLDWRLGTAIQGIRLQVQPEDEQAARELLAAEFQGAEEDGEFTEEPLQKAETILCPACGSDRVGPPSWRKKTKAAALFFPVVLLAWPLVALIESRHQCAACGHAWR